MDDNNNKKKSSPYLTKEFISFWLAGVLNNATYVVMNAGAKEIAPTAVGYVYVCNVLPSFLVQLTGPYWYHYISYTNRMKMVATCMCISFIAVAFGQIYNNLYLQFFGIAITSFQSGFGEVSFLSFSAFYPNSRLVLTGWSSGTGMAGIVGYAWVSILMYQFQLSFYWVLFLGLIFPFLYSLNILFILPWPEISREEKQMNIGTTSSSSRNNNNNNISNSDYTILHNSDNNSNNNNKYPSAGNNNDNNNNNSSSLLSVVEEQQNNNIVIGDQEIEINDSNVDKSNAAVSMSGAERFKVAISLWKYMFPLFLVYFAEYVTQSGTWAAIGFPITNKMARNKFYEYANFTYQIGVFFSRSSGLLCKANLKVMWLLPLVQVGLMLFFISDAYDQYWYDWTLLIPAFCVGLIGGAVYIGVFALIAEEVKPELKEFSMSVAIIANTIGILMSNICGVYVQKELYKYHHLDK